MKKQIKAPCGSWKSPFTGESIVKKSIGLSEIRIDNGYLYWLEMRPTEGGRYVIVKSDIKGQTQDAIPEDFNARTRVHEYGGGSYLVNREIIYFSNFKDQRVYRLSPNKTPVPITPDKKLRYADGVFDTLRNKIIFVREDHTKAGREPVNTLVSLNPEEENAGDIIAEGNDFYSSPRIDRTCTHIAWLTWKHPNMPWDSTELWAGTLNMDGSLKEKTLVAGGNNESVFQPGWSHDGVLYFISDRSGWWNLYRWKNGTVEPLFTIDCEFGVPQWIFGMNTYSFVKKDNIICTYYKDGAWRLGLLDLVFKRLKDIKVPYTSISYPCSLENDIYFIGGSPVKSPSIVQLHLGTLGHKTLRSSLNIKLSKQSISQPEEIRFPTSDGDIAFAYFYKPRNEKYLPKNNEKPPLIVKSHGGPTSCARTSLSLETQYWTSRGFAVVDVNYRGSTSFGRKYRNLLQKKWGVYDVDDCINAAKYLVSKGLADKNRLIIRGGSAGGYTTLCALTFHDVFKAGASYYGVSDLEILVRDTHKFESRYLDKLIGPYPEKKKLYHERSPIYHTDKLSCPLIILQGIEDKIVPVNQAELIYKAVLKKGLPVAYITFEGEQHGFRQAKNIKQAIESELYFYSRIFKFKSPDKLSPIEIKNI
ncbi:MAG: S9 family peptidase [Endomicrobiales bacterium]|nr:S9 family peptidase [Endomicrobiales bacterium]